MSLKAYNIDVPITPGVMPPVIHIGQYDSGRDYICHLKNDDGTDYTIPSGTTATFTGCNPRKEVFELEATVDTSANTITITPQDEATSMFGKYGATINLFLNDEQMSPIVILMDVQKAGATDDEIAGAANFPDAVTEAVNDWLEENVEAGQLGDLYVPQAAQAEKTDAMTQPVGIDGNGKLWTTPGEGGGSTEGAVLYNQSQSLTSTQKSQARTNIGAGTYSKPSGGIPKTDLASAVQTSLGKADSAYQKPSGGIPSTDMAQTVQTALTAAGTAVQPAALADYITKAAQGTKLSTDTVPVKIDANGKLWVAGGGESVQEVMIVTITRNGSTYTSDTTDDDIVAAAANGMLIMAQTPITGGFAYYSYEDEGAIFYGISGDSQSSTFNISRYSVEGTSVTVTEQDVTPMVVTVTSGSGGAYTTDTDEATILAAVAAGREVIANALGHRFYFMDSDNGATFFSIIGTGTTRAILRLVIDGTNVTVEGIVPVNAGLITPKTAAMTQAVGYRASDGTLWTVPGSGGGGISKTVVTISGSTCDTSLADIIAAYQNGNVIECWAEGLQCWLGYPPDSFGAQFFGIDTDSGNMLYGYHVGANGTVTAFSAHIGNADKPEQIPLEGTTPTIAFAGDNAIYTGGTLTSLTVTQFGNSGMFMLIFDSGSSPTSLNLPAYDSAHPTNNYVKWGDFTVEANKHYEVSINVINGVGYLVGKGW